MQKGKDTYYILISDILKCSLMTSSSIITCMKSQITYTIYIVHSNPVARQLKRALLFVMQHNQILQRINKASIHRMSIERLQKLIQLQCELTTAISQAEQFVDDGSAASYPKSMNDVNEILALAHTFSSRTTAPIGWDPAYGTSTAFATPAPLPHQLRAGNLGGLQLQRARSEKQKQRLEEEKNAENKVKDRSSDSKATRNDDTSAQKRKQVQNVKITPPKKANVVASMNLSDSSSDSSDEDSD